MKLVGIFIFLVVGYFLCMSAINSIATLGQKPLDIALTSAIFGALGTLLVFFRLRHIKARQGAAG